MEKAKKSEPDIRSTSCIIVELSLRLPSLTPFDITRAAHSQAGESGTAAMVRSRSESRLRIRTQCASGAVGRNSRISRSSRSAARSASSPAPSNVAVYCSNSEPSKSSRTLCCTVGRTNGVLLQSWSLSWLCCVSWPECPNTWRLAANIRLGIGRSTRLWVSLNARLSSARASLGTAGQLYGDVVPVPPRRCAEHAHTSTKRSTAALCAAAS